MINLKLQKYKDDKMEIYYIDRKTGEKKKEIVKGHKYLEWSYDTKIGRFFLETLFKRKLASYIYGKLQDLSSSSKNIKSFVDELSINMEEAIETDPLKYKTFNDFFIRELKPDARPINNNKNVFISPADGKVFAYENIDIHKVIQVKGMEYSLVELFSSENLASQYEGGTCIVVRLAPSDYHRFHFPDSGVPKLINKIKGKFYSVNPIALKRIQKLYCQNKRELTLFESDNFGKIIMVEVGATCVGTIIQTYEENKWVERGKEKGYFKFGGSTVILFLQKDQVKIDEDIVNNTDLGYETKVYMGEEIGVKK